MPTADTLLDPHVEEIPVTARPWKVILYNDDVHEFTEVVMQVQRATGCALEIAEWITHEAHTRGRAIAYEGEKEACSRAAAILRQIRLQVELDEA